MCGVLRNRQASRYGDCTPDAGRAKSGAFKALCRARQSRQCACRQGDRGPRLGSSGGTSKSSSRSGVARTLCGGLMSYRPIAWGAIRQVGICAHPSSRVRTGRPASHAFEFAINLQAAKMLGIKARQRCSQPPTRLSNADAIVQLLRYRSLSLHPAPGLL
jgi:hypothetical protein